MKREIPIAITFVVGVALIVAFFIPVAFCQKAGDTAQSWAIIVFSFAIVLGILNLFLINIKKVFKKAPGWGYSLVLLLGFIVTSVLGIGWGIKSGTPFYYVFDNIYNPLSSTMFALLAFFIASAAFRAFRAKSREATLLLIAAFIVMLGRVPIGDFLVQKKADFFNYIHFTWGYHFLMKHKLSDLAEWIMAYPNTAGQRAIMIGAALGAISTSIKILLGVEKTYLGKEEK